MKYAWLTIWSIIIIGLTGCSKDEEECNRNWVIGDNTFYIPSSDSKVATQLNTTDGAIIDYKLDQASSSVKAFDISSCDELFDYNRFSERLINGSTGPELYSSIVTYRKLQEGTEVNTYETLILSWTIDEVIINNIIGTVEDVVVPASINYYQTDTLHFQQIGNKLTIKDIGQYSKLGYVYIKLNNESLWRYLELEQSSSTPQVYDMTQLKPIKISTIRFSDTDNWLVNVYGINNDLNNEVLLSYTFDQLENSDYVELLLPDLNYNQYRIEARNSSFFTRNVFNKLMPNVPDQINLERINTPEISVSINGFSLNFDKRIDYISASFRSSGSSPFVQWRIYGECGSTSCSYQLPKLSEQLGSDFEQIAAGEYRLSSITTYRMDNPSDYDYHLNPSLLNLTRLQGRLGTTTQTFVF